MLLRRFDKSRSEAVLAGLLLASLGAFYPVILLTSQETGYSRASFCGTLREQRNRFGRGLADLELG